MSRYAMPAYPLDLHAPGAVDGLLAFHKATFGGWRMEGDDGGSGGDSGAGQGNPGGSDGAAFPSNTAPEDMTSTQREAYYKAETTKWRGRAEKNYSTLRDLGIRDDDTAAHVKAKLAEHSELSKAQMNAVEKAAADATEKAKSETEGIFRPELIKARIEVAAARKGVSDEKVQAALEFLDLSKFVKQSGDVDLKKVETYVEGLTPTKGTTQRSGPTVFGLGQTPPSGGAKGQQGLEMARKRGYVKADAS